MGRLNKPHQAAATLARRLGGRIVWLKTDLFQGARQSGRTWFVNVNAANLALAVLVHEAFHSIRAEQMAVEQAKLGIRLGELNELI